MISSIKNILYCLISAVLLVLAFPTTDYWLFAFFGLVPLLLVLDGKKNSHAFLLGFFTGIIFFAGTMYWLGHVTVPGTIILILYLSLYFGFFALGYTAYTRWRVLWKLLLLPSLWVVLEFIRGHLFSGFGWLYLGHSQSKNLAVAQMADIVGVEGISFFLFMINFSIKEILGMFIFGRPDPMKKEIHVSAIATTCLLTVVLVYGFYHLNLNNKKGATAFRIAIVQANIPQELKWEEFAWPWIIQKHLTWTDKIVDQKPDIIVWPETSFP